MIERIVDWSIKHRYLTLGFFFLISGVGIWAVTTTPMDAIPDLSENQVIVFTEYMGRSPQIVEDQVTFPLVSALQGLPKVQAVRAQSMFGMSFIYVIFDDGVENYWARTRVLERLASVKSDLPNDAAPALGPDGTGVGHVYWYTLEGKGQDLASLRSLQDWFIKPLLQSVDGVAEIASIGGYVRQYQVNVDPNKLRSYGITIGNVQQAVMQANNNVGGKILEVNDQENFVRGQGYIRSLGDLRQIPLLSSGGTAVTIGDVANVTFGADLRRGSLEKNGKGEVVGGIVVMRQGENAKEVIDRVKARIGEIAPGLPQGVTIEPAYDRSVLIEASVKTLAHTLIEEAIIVTLVVMIFLVHLPSALRVIIEIPVSVLIAFILMKMIGITSNIMSLGGIAIGIGILVDASIVMLENAHRHLAEAQDREEREGTPFVYADVIARSVKQVARPIFFSILIIVVSFLPVFLLIGQEGKLFHPLAYTKSFSLLGSAVVSITLVPVLMTLIMRGRFRTEEHNPVSNFFGKLYRPVLDWSLNNRKTVIIVNLAMLLLAIPVALRMGSEFMPPLDEGSLLFMPTMLPSVSVAEATRIVEMQDSIIKAYPEVTNVVGKVGKAETATDPAPVSMIETLIDLKPRSEWRAGLTKDKIIADLNRELQIPGVANGWTQPIINRINMLSTGVRTDLGVKIFGSNFDTLERIATDAEAILREIPGAADVVAERVQGGRFLDIKVKPEAAARYGISSGGINEAVEAAIGGKNISTVVDSRARYPISVRYQTDFRNDIESIKNLPVAVGSASGPLPQSSAMGGNASGIMPQTVGSTGAMPTVGGSAGMGSSGGTMGSGGGSIARPGSNGPMAPRYSSAQYNSSVYDWPRSSPIQFIPLGQLADITRSPGPPMIASENGLLRSVVFLNVRGRDMGGFVKEARAKLTKSLVMPAGYALNWSGQFEHQERAKNRLILIVPMVFLLIFSLLYFTLRDVREAGVVMLSVPFALLGGVFFVSLLGYNWSVAVWVGFIALYGIAVETGVVMVVYLHEALDKKLAEGVPMTPAIIFEAAREGAALRLRPKLMTVATAMLGLIPILWSTGTGADVMKPIAAPMIGGMLTSALHVLIITPVLFYLMKLRELKRGTLRQSEISGWMKH